LRQPDLSDDEGTLLSGWLERGQIETFVLKNFVRSAIGRESDHEQWIAIIWTVLEFTDKEEKRMRLRIRDVFASEKVVRGMKLKSVYFVREPRSNRFLWICRDPGDGLFGRKRTFLPSESTSIALKLSRPWGVGSNLMEMLFPVSGKTSVTRCAVAGPI
jgi:hypothetical protein